MDQESEAQDLRDLYTAYLDAWNRRDLDAYCALFAFPITVGGGGREPQRVPNLADWRAQSAANLDSLARRGWARSVLDALHVGIMAGETGVITVAYARERGDGSRMESGTSNYVARRIEGDWKIVGMIVP